MHREHDLAADRSRLEKEQIVGAPDRALGEFSTGTTPYAAAPDSTLWNVSSMLPHGKPCTEPPKCLTTASSLNVPGGPR